MIARSGTVLIGGPVLLSLALFFPAETTRPADLKMSGVWDYNVDESVDAYTGMPEERRSTRDEPTTEPLSVRNPPQGSDTGGRGGGPPMPPPTPYGRIVGAANAIAARAAANGPKAMTPIVIDESKILLRDLLEIPRQLSVTVRDNAVTFVDDLNRARTYPADRKKHRYQLGAATFNATAFWDADQFKKEIKSPAQGFKLTETYVASEDGSRLFVIIRLGDPQQGEPVSGVNRVYDRVESRGSHVRVRPQVTVTELAPSGSTTPPSAAAAPPPVSTAAQPEPTPPSGQVFRAGTRVVPVYATVANAAGSFVLNLQQHEFVVKDDGKVQPIVQFTTDEQALSIVLLIDGSSSMLPSFTTVIDGVNSFVVRLRPADRTRIASFANDMRFGPAFTSDRDALLEFLKNGANIRMGNQTKLWDSLMDSAIALKDAPGRRVVVVFSDGDDRGSHTWPRDVETMAANLDVMIYALSTWTWDPVDKRTVAPTNALKNLAMNTGGGYYELRETQDMNATFTRVAEELHRVYLLGFVPQTLDDKTHKLYVQVSRPGLTVRARKTYVATKAK